MSESVSAPFWCIIGNKNSNKVTSSSPIKIVYSQTLPVWQEVVPLLDNKNKKSHYSSFKMNIEVQNMC